MGLSVTRGSELELSFNGCEETLERKQGFPESTKSLEFPRNEQEIPRDIVMGKSVIST